MNWNTILNQVVKVSHWISFAVKLLRKRCPSICHKWQAKWGQIGPFYKMKRSKTGTKRGRPQSARPQRATSAGYRFPLSSYTPRSEYHSSCVPAKPAKAPAAPPPVNHSEATYVKCDMVTQDEIWKQAVNVEKKGVKQWWVSAAVPCLTRPIFSQILTKDTPQLRASCGVSFCEHKLGFMFCLSYCSVVCKTYHIRAHYEFLTAPSGVK